jgi:hypothetical protein
MCDFGLVKGLMIKEEWFYELIQSIGGLFLKGRDRSFGEHRVSRDVGAKDLFKAKKKSTLPGTVKDSLFARNAESQGQRFRRGETPLSDAFPMR